MQGSSHWYSHGIQLLPTKPVLRGESVQGSRREHHRVEKPGGFRLREARSDQSPQARLVSTATAHRPPPGGPCSRLVPGVLGTPGTLLLSLHLSANPRPEVPPPLLSEQLKLHIHPDMLCGTVSGGPCLPLGARSSGHGIQWRVFSAPVQRAAITNCLALIPRERGSACPEA